MKNLGKSQRSKAYFERDDLEILDMLIAVQAAWISLSSISDLDSDDLSEDESSDVLASEDQKKY